jgi:hypothetical protein
VGADDDVIYDVVTNLPVYLNGTSADTGPGSGGGEPPEKVKRDADNSDSKLVEKEKKRREKRAKGRKERLRREKRGGRKLARASSRRLGIMRRDEMWGQGRGI